MAHSIPKRAGYYWAQWRICDPGTDDEEEFQPSNEWEPVVVFENCIDTSHAEYLRVFVPGVSQGQSIENFVWGPELEGSPAEWEEHDA